MKRTLEYDAPSDNSLTIDFDDVAEAQYRLDIHPDSAADGDGVVLVANRSACLAFARLFAQLAEYDGHVHLGYDEKEPQGPGLRIVVSEEPHARFG